MIPEEKLIIEMIKAAEAQLDKRGWDGTAPQVTLLFVKDMGAVYGVEGLPSPIQPTDLDLQPGEGSAAAIAAIGKMFLEAVDEGVPPFLSDEAAAEFAGVMVNAEAWFLRSPYKDLPEPGRIGDHPDAKEARMVQILDCAGRFYQVNRVRGEEPDLLVTAGGDTEVRLVGDVPEGMRDMMLALCRSLPAGGADLEKIAALVQEEPGGFGGVGFSMSREL